MPHLSFQRLFACLLLVTHVVVEAQARPVAPATTPQYSVSDLKNYAETLVEVTRVQSALASALSAGASANPTALKQQANAKIAEILKQHDLDAASFNAISARVEDQPAVRAQVNQFAMDELVGT
jgi:hypothetical protein